MADRACENTHPSRAANMAIHGLNSVAASDFMDNEDSQSPIKASVFAGYKVIHGAFAVEFKLFQMLLPSVSVPATEQM
eukprot:40818-Eustigmatos_ZCMA.PRE.1